MSRDWRRLDAALAVHGAQCWWRDDDAVDATPALERLLALAEDTGAPLLLAVIPMAAREALARRLERAASVEVAVHGHSHANHAPPGEKKAEFGAHRPLDVMAAEAAAGKERIAALFGGRAVPVFVPPWNRMDPALVPELAAAGYAGYSTFAHERPLRTPLPRIDALLDPVDWRGTRSAVAAQSLIDRAAALVEMRVPIGLMTHHLMHDEAVWELTEALVRRLSAGGARWLSARAVFATPETVAQPGLRR